MASTTASSDGTFRGMVDSETQIIWFGEENADQDVRIRFVRNCINDEVDDNHPLAYLMVHSDRLKTCSSYFGAILRWSSEENSCNPKQSNLQEITVHVSGDLRFYTDCFSRMYNPLMVTSRVTFEDVEYSLQLLSVATQLGCDDLMSSICLYLASIYPWSDEDEMRIRSSVLSEDFPLGHAQDLLSQERLYRQLRTSQQIALFWLFEEFED